MTNETIDQSSKNNEIPKVDEEAERIFKEKDKQMTVARTLGLPITGSVALYLQMGLKYRDALNRANDVDVYMGTGKDIPQYLFHKYYFEKRQKVKQSGAEVVTETFSPGLEKRTVSYSKDSRGQLVFDLIFINDILKDNVELLLAGTKNIGFFFTSEERVVKVLQRVKRIYEAKPHIKGMEKDITKLKNEIDKVIDIMLPILADKKNYDRSGIVDQFYLSIIQEITAFRDSMKRERR